MNPIYFGASTSPLFGVYHPPLARTASPRCVLLCPAVGQEYIRAHRAFRQLGVMLARAGHHILRFDYSGTGDSAGDGSGASLEQWERDVLTAAEEIRDTSGIERLSLVGLRLGATMALRSCRPVSADDLVLWDPVTEGPSYLEELYATYFVSAEERERSARGELIGIGGLPAPSALVAGIGEIALAGLPLPELKRALVICTTPDAAARDLAARLGTAGANGRYADVAMAGRWDDADTVGAVLLPQAVLKAIALHFSDTA